MNNIIIYICIFILLIIMSFLLFNKYHFKSKYGGSKSRSILAFEHNQLKPIFNITIKEIPCISKELFSKMLEIIYKRHKLISNFSHMTIDDNKYFEEQISFISKEEISPISKEQLLNQIKVLRNMEISKFIMHSNIKNKPINTDFLKGESIMKIADKYKLPYLVTLNQLLSNFNYSHNEIKQIIKNGEIKQIKDSINDEIKNSINTEINKILNADLNSAINQQKNKYKATQFEEKIANKLTKLGIKFKTEQDFNKIEQGTLTPDFLFDPSQTIILNGQHINWLDAKNFLFYKNSIMEKKIKLQATKYTKAFGFGAFIFSQGSICIDEKNTLYLGSNDFE